MHSLATRTCFVRPPTDNEPEKDEMDWERRGWWRQEAKRRACLCGHALNGKNRRFLKRRLVVRAQVDRVAYIQVSPLQMANASLAGGVNCPYAQMPNTVLSILRNYLYTRNQNNSSQQNRK